MYHRVSQIASDGYLKIGFSRILLNPGVGFLPGQLNDLPLNEFTAQDNPRGSEPGEQFFGGDVRTSEAPGLSIMINLMVREHNRLARHHVKWLKKAGKPVRMQVPA